MTEPASSAASGASSASVTGQVVEPNGLPIAEATVLIVEGHVSHPDVAALTDASGRFVLGGLEPGWYNIEARAGERTRRRSVDLGAGEQVWLDFVL